MDAVERARAFLLAMARDGAGEVEDAPWGFAVRHRAFPISHAHNQLWVSRPAPGWLLLRETELRLADVGHRQLTVVDDGLGRSVAPLLRTAGYVHMPELLMFAEDVDTASEARALAAPVPFADVRAPMATSWRREIPDLDDDGVRQLVERTPTAASGSALTLFGVRQNGGGEGEGGQDGDGGQVVAWCQLFERDGMAQIEDVNTLKEWRGRGFASAVVRAALAAAHSRGAGPVFLVADEHDWPRHLYRRLGFRERGRIHVFARSA